MKNITRFTLIIFLYSTLAYSIEIPNPKFGSRVEDEISKYYKGLPKTTPRKQLDWAKSIINSNIHIVALKEFIDQNPQSDLLPEAIFFYGKEMFGRGYKNEALIFEYLLNKYPNSEYSKKSYRRYIEALFMYTMYDEIEDPNKDIQEVDNYKRKFCDQFLATENWKKIELNKFLETNHGRKAYEIVKCTQFKIGLNEDGNDAHLAKISNDLGEQTGFKVDLLLDNETKKIFSKYEIIFDFTNLKVNEVMNLRSETQNQDIIRTYEILEISNEKILFQQTVTDFFEFCQNLRMVSPRKSNTEKLKASTPIEDCNDPKKFNEEARKFRRGTNDPVYYLSFDLKNNKLTKEYWPLGLKKMKIEYKKVELDKGRTLNLVYDIDLSNLSLSSKNINKFSSKTKIQKAIEFAFWAGSIYLLATNIKSIISMSKGSSKISVKSSAGSSGSSSFANRSIQQKYKILKYYGYIR